MIRQVDFDRPHVMAIDAEVAIDRWLNRQSGDVPNGLLESLRLELEEYQRLLWRRGWRLTADDLTLIIAKLQTALVTDDPERRSERLERAVEMLRETRRALEIQM